ncbi:MAG: alpha/beta hydrolase [Thermoanaerobaculia bacterium]|jgi:pimeloyl-ACP methyl ester carboxylesterase
MARTLIFIAFALFAVVIIVLGAAIWYFYSHPMATLEALSRRGLRGIGCEKRSVDGPAGSVTYFTVGSGPAVVLVHGANDQAGLWRKTIEALKSDHKVVALDLPGHGESAPAKGPLQFETLMGGLRAVIDKECPDGKVVVVGNSLGGWLAMLWALEHPARTAGVVLENAGGVAIDYKGPSLLPKNREEAAAVTKAVLGPSSPPVPGYVLDDLVRRAPKSQVARLAGVDVKPWILDDKLTAVTFPVALVWGKDDGIATIAYAEHYQSLIPNATLTAIPRCGHIPHNQCPAAFNTKLKEAIGGWK